MLVFQSFYILLVLALTFLRVCVIRESLDMEENTSSRKAGILKLHCVKRVLIYYYPPKEQN